MEQTPAPGGSTTERNNTEHHHSDDFIHVTVLSCVIPVCTLIVVLLIVRRIILRRRRVNGVLSTAVFVIPDPVEQSRPVPHSIPDIERVTKPKQIRKQKSKHKKFKLEKLEKLVKNIKNDNTRNRPDVHFPREPIYKSQQTPSYLVPFTALPANFDFSLSHVEVHSDFVIIKDLDILQTYWYENENDYNSREEYKKQNPYNPSFT